MTEYIELKFPRYTVYLTPGEIQYLLQNIDQVEAFNKAIKRGKAIKKLKQMEKRVNKKIEKLEAAKKAIDWDILSQWQE